MIVTTRAAFLMALAVTVVAALTPPEAHPLQLFPWEKGDHLLAFYVLSVLAAAAAPRLPLLAIGAGLTLLGAGIELAQGIPLIHRDPALSDVGLDGLAIIAALAPIFLWRRVVDAKRPR